MTARYFMNLRHRNRLYRDEKSDELEGEHAVRDHALSTARDLVRTRSSIVRDWFACSF